MQGEFDVRDRLTAIAEATLEIAWEDGPRAVTIRSIAARLGGSTTMVTKFVPTRTALIENALRHIQRTWDEDLAASLGNRTGIDRLRALIEWTFSTTEYDKAIRPLWIETFTHDRDAATASRKQAHDEANSLRDAISSAGLSHDSDWLGDLLFLAARGYFVSTIEDPDEWTDDRAARAASRLLDLAQKTGEGRR
jgi:AcrR family transcriptional regulator